MHTLIVTSHPNPDSLTGQTARLLQRDLGVGNSEIADLHAEGFDPRFMEADWATYTGKGTDPTDVTTEQRRLDRATDLVLVFPMYWWSVPALMKGWIDRVFIKDWAFNETESGHISPLLQDLTLHLLPLAGTDASGFARYGYDQSFETAFMRGVADFCGAQRGALSYFYETESEDPVALEANMLKAVRGITSAIEQSHAQPQLEPR